MNIKRFLNWKKKEAVVPAEEASVAVEEMLESIEEEEAIEEELEEMSKEKNEEVLEEKSKEVTEEVLHPHATGDEECFKAVREMFEEATENAMRNMPMWMRLNYFANTISRTDGKNVNWDKVNKFLMLGIDKKKPYYNICGRIRNVEQLKRAAMDAQLAGIPEFNMPFYRRRCKQCGNMFELTLGEIQSYEKKGLHIPSRCWHCRKGIDKQTGEHIVPKQVEEEPAKTEMQIAMEKAGIC